MIEIAGYRIQRLLGKGGMASVYLALQESVQREVALKVMAPTLVGAEFGERFLREARIAAGLRHPHVVQVHDVGRSGDWHYIAMEHLAGGPVLRRDPPRELDFVLRVTREIADALGYAHARGVVHRDIKPDNLLLREDGSAVLTDFGIARASDSARMTQAGMIMGTPHYMAPEQATGAPIDGRADLYALGVVLHELLLGRVPFDADDWVAVGLMHLSAPLPRLPPQFARVQPLLDRMLAKQPEQRFQSGGELADAVAALEAELFGTATPVRRRPPESERVVVAGPPGEPAEPTLGELGTALVDAGPRPRRRSRPAPMSVRARGWLGAALVSVLLIAAAAWVWREPLQQWRPATGFEQLLREADRALQAGRLVAGDGSGARQLYARAVALDPDDERAIDGLRRVGEAAVGQARRALDEDRPEAARDSLSLARELGVAASSIEPLEQALRAREQRDVQVGQLLFDARRALDEERLDGDDGALALYRRALQAMPDNEPARAGLRDTLGRLLARADARIAAGALDEAAAQIDAVAAIDPAHLRLNDSRAALAEARAARSGGVARRLGDAEQLLRRGRLVAPPGDNAREAYRAVLALEPGQRDAVDGLRRVAEALLAQAERQLADFRFDQAQALIDEARATDPALPGLRRASQRLAERRAARGALTGTAPLEPAQQRALDGHLQAAAQALAAGRLVHPPGDSAFDRYKAALSIDPSSQAARDGIAAIPAAARRFFEEAISRQRLSSARGYVEGLETVAPADPALFDMKRRLARSLLGYADERLGAGELQRARDAFEQASELDPGNPELAAMRARLEQAMP